MSAQTKTTDFGAKYINTNIAPDATPYDEKTFKNFMLQLNSNGDSHYKGHELTTLAAMLCGIRRADIVPKLFQTLTRFSTEEQTLQLFYQLEEALSIVFPFVGLPNCMPACLGLVWELKSRGITPSSQTRRSSFTEKDWASDGDSTRKMIYRGVGNPEVHAMIAAYFPDLSYVADAAVFGFLLGGSLEVQTLQQAELAVAAAITAMGATRQARSHCKAAVGVGNSLAVVQSVVDVADQLATWNGGKALAAIDVKELASELEAELKKT